MDLGGHDVLAPGSHNRLTLRQTFRDIEFAANPSTRNASADVVYVTSILDASFENCILPHPVPSVVNHVRYVGAVIGSSEPDKVVGTLIVDDSRCGEAAEATGVEYYLVRNSKIAPVQISPRQLRLIGCTVDATDDRYLWYPITWAYNGPILSVEVTGTILKINPTNADVRVMPHINPMRLTLGRDAEWNGSRLIIHKSSPVFLDWQVWLFEGMIVTQASDWGVVRKLSGGPDGSAIWADIQWIAGARPTAGQLLGGRGHSLVVDDTCRLDGRAAWGAPSGGFMREHLPPSFGAASHDFPPGYPARDYGF
jgi:hypothetical protein